MKSIMGFGFFLLFLAGIALVMLQGRDMARRHLPAGGSGITGLEWRPAVIGADEVPADSGMFVVFQVDGSINGNGGCNKFFGSLETTEDGLAVGELGASRMACPGDIMERETAFMKALQETSRFEIGEDSLQLVGAGNQLLVELVAAD
jgi:heat shock protein HslJ